jgi:hypothetical protein
LPRSIRQFARRQTTQGGGDEQGSIHQPYALLKQVPYRQAAGDLRSKAPFRRLLITGW